MCSYVKFKNKIKLKKKKENRLMDMGRVEERVSFMEKVTETYIIICKIDSQWKFAVWLSELKPGLCNNLEGWEGV